MDIPALLGVCVQNNPIWSTECNNNHYSSEDEPRRWPPQSRSASHKQIWDVNHAALVNHYEINLSSAELSKAINRKPPFYIRVRISFHRALFGRGPKNPPPDESPGRPDPAFLMGSRCSRICFHHFHCCLIYTDGLLSLGGLPGATCFIFAVITRFGHGLKSHSTLRGPCSHPPCNNKQEPRKKPLCFGVNPDRRVHAGILIYGDCRVLTLPAVLVGAWYFLELTKYGLLLLGEKEEIKYSFFLLLAYF